MTLSEKQQVFSVCVAKLILFANGAGYKITFGDALAKGGHIAGSYHYKGLAVDLNLFKNGEYLTKTEDHSFLGEYWKSLNPLCTWGGDFKRKDGNHYSFGEGKP